MSEILGAIGVPLLAMVIIIGAVFAWAALAGTSAGDDWYSLAVPPGSSTAPTSTTGYPNSPDTPDGNVNIMERYPGRIIYTLETDRDPGPYDAHCREQGGAFQACGKPCASEAQACVEICAFTCDL